MNWDHVTTKATLLEEIKRFVKKKIEKEKFFNSVIKFTIRLRLILKRRRIYLLNKIYHFVQSFTRYRLKRKMFFSVETFLIKTFIRLQDSILPLPVMY
jgi:hypothetical protein